MADRKRPPSNEDPRPPSSPSQPPGGGQRRRRSDQAESSQPAETLNPQSQRFDPSPNPPNLKQNPQIGTQDQAGSSQPSQTLKPQSQHSDPSPNPPNLQQNPQIGTQDQAGSSRPSQTLNPQSQRSNPSPNPPNLQQNPQTETPDRQQRQRPQFIAPQHAGNVAASSFGVKNCRPPRPPRNLPAQQRPQISQPSQTLIPYQNQPVRTPQALIGQHHHQPQQFFQPPQPQPQAPQPRSQPPQVTGPQDYELAPFPSFSYEEQVRLWARYGDPSLETLQILHPNL